VGRWMHGHLWHFGAAIIVACLLATTASAQPADRAGQMGPGTGATATPNAPPDQASREALPWMGLRVAPVPDALAAHLPLARNSQSGEREVGLMVINLVEAGPADTAGLKRYDVIVAADGEPVSDRMGKFVRQMSQYRPGDRVRLTVLRRAQRKTLSLTMGRSEPALQAQYEYRYAEMPTAVLQEKTNVKSAVLRRGEDGWVLEPIDETDPAMFMDLPQDIRDQVMQWTGPADKLERTAVVRDDASIEIIRREGGQVTVRRISRAADGEQRKTSQTYPNARRLREADPKAYAIYQQIESDPALADDAGQADVASASVEREVERDAGMSEPAAEPNAGQPSRTNRMMRTLDEAAAYRDHIENYEQFIEAYRNYLIAGQDEQSDGNDPQLDPILKELARRLKPDRPERQFRVEPSGRIELHIRKPTGELVLAFESVQELRSRYPKLYEQYQQLIADEPALEDLGEPSDGGTQPVSDLEP